jgi:hypothetical protein
MAVSIEVATVRLWSVRLLLGEAGRDFPEGGRLRQAGGFVDVATDAVDASISVLRSLSPQAEGLDHLVRIPEAAAASGLSYQYLWGMARRGEIPVHPADSGHGRRISAADVAILAAAGPFARRNVRWPS